MTVDELIDKLHTLKLNNNAGNLKVYLDKEGFGDLDFDVAICETCKIENVSICWDEDLPVNSDNEDAVVLKIV